MSRPHHEPHFLLRAERWNNALRRDWLVLRLGAGPTPIVNFHWFVLDSRRGVGVLCTPPPATLFHVW